MADYIFGRNAVLESLNSDKAPEKNLYLKSRIKRADLLKKRKYRT